MDRRPLPHSLTHPTPHDDYAESDACKHDPWTTRYGHPRMTTIDKPMSADDRSESAKRPSGSGHRLRIRRHRLWVRPVRRICRNRSVILGYHGVGRTPLREDLSFLQVRPERFRAQLELLLSAGFKFVTVAQLARLADGREPPAGYAAISFADGMRNNLTTALPIMSEYGIPGTVYMTVGYLAGRSPWVQSPEDNRMMDETELRAIATAGWEVGAHTMTHADLSTLGHEDSAERSRRARSSWRR